MQTKYRPPNQAESHPKYCAPSPYGGKLENLTDYPPESVFRLERKLDRYNHIMELMRTCLALFTVTLQIVILLKLFNLI